LMSVLFEIASFWPHRLRRHCEALDDSSLRRGMLSGAPDSVVTKLVDRWRQERDPDTLDAIARIRTDFAGDVLLTLREEIGDDERWELLIEMSGRLPDSHER